MSEACPLYIGQIVTDGNIPEVCRTHCEDIWLNLPATDVPDIDVFNDLCGDTGETCTHEIEHGQHSLSVFDESAPRKRGYTVLNSCVPNETDVSNENYTFDCRNPDIESE